MKRENITNGLSAMVSVKLDGLKTVLLLDTGAAVTVISSDIFFKIPQESRPDLQCCDNVKLEAVMYSLSPNPRVSNPNYETTDTPKTV
jgi:hypothetical protein